MVVPAVAAVRVKNVVPEAPGCGGGVAGALLDGAGDGAADGEEGYVYVVVEEGAR